MIGMNYYTVDTNCFIMNAWILNLLDSLVWALIFYDTGTRILSYGHCNCCNLNLYWNRNCAWLKEVPVFLRSGSKLFDCMYFILSFLCRMNCIVTGLKLVMLNFTTIFILVLYQLKKMIMLFGDVFYSQQNEVWVLLSTIYVQFFHYVWNYNHILSFRETRLWWIISCIITGLITTLLVIILNLHLLSLWLLTRNKTLKIRYWFIASMYSYQCITNGTSMICRITYFLIYIDYGFFCAAYFVYFLDLLSTAYSHPSI